MTAGTNSADLSVIWQPHRAVAKTQRVRVVAPGHETHARPAPRASVFDALCGPVLYTHTIDPLADQIAPPAAETMIADQAVHAVIESIMEIEGALAVAVVNHQTGTLLGGLGSGINLQVAAAGNSEVVRAKLKVIETLGLSDQIEDILITLSGQLHLIRILKADRDLFLYVVLNRAVANLGLARIALQDAERLLTLR